MILYQNTDASAPVLSGTAGAFNNLLYACLVTGYGVKTGAGWTREFSGTNKGVYRSSAGNRMFFRVDDTGTTSARVVGYENMTDVDTGTNAFPTSTQVSGGLYWQKSGSADATARSWILMVDDRYLIFAAEYLPLYWQVYAFGDVPSLKVNDVYNTIIIGNASVLTYSSMLSTALPNSPLDGHYMARRYDGMGTSLKFAKCIKEALTYNQTSAIISGAHCLLKYPDPLTGCIRITPFKIYETAIDCVQRAWLPGIWFVGHVLPLNNNDIFSGAVGSDLEGKQFRYLSCGNNTCAIVIEISDTWYDVSFA